MLEGIKRDWLDLYWPVVEPWIVSAVRDAGSLWTAADCRQMLNDRKLQMWVAWATPDNPSVVVLTEVYDTAAGLTCAIPVVGGSDLAACLEDGLAVIERWAREQGCVRLRGEGRAGWERVLKPHGWRVVTTQVEKAL